MSYYEELGVPKTATNEQIRAAYRRKAKQLHPDRGGDAEAMARVNRAYETLSSAPKRLTYDRTGEEIAAPAIDQIAQGILLKEITQWLGSEMNSGDLVADVGEKFRNDQRDLLKNIVAGEKKMKMLRKRIKRLKFRGKGPDVVRQSVEHMITELGQKIERVKDQASHVERAQELLKGYEYEREPAAPMAAMRTGLFVNGKFFETP